MALPMGLALGMLLALLALLPVGPGNGLIPIASAHAILVRSDPPANAKLQAPPSQVRLWFSEDVNGGTSRVVVVDPANRQVDNKDAHVSSGDSKEMDVSLPLLPAGSYVVVWRTQSADDGHVTGGSFLFRIAKPDGSFAPPPSVLPTGNIPGGGGTGAVGDGTLDGPTVFQAISTWLALLFMTFWVGGLIWETWILPPGAAHDPDVSAAGAAASRRFRRLAPYALGLVLLTDVGLVLAQGAQLAGEWSGAFAPPLLRAILFGSRFGTFWWLRELAAGAALALTLIAARQGWPVRKAAKQPAGEVSGGAEAGLVAVADWRRELVETFRGVPNLPGRLAGGWRALEGIGRAELLLAALLLVAFALSGHAAAVPANTFAFAICVDVLHLLAEAAWIGGLLYIGAALVPVLYGMRVRQRARVLALGLPEFGAVAIVSALLLAATGSLNATIRLTSLEQFLTTTYGRTLAIKIELFLIMTAISAYHAFFLRPRLAKLLASAEAATETKPTPSAAPAIQLTSATVGAGRADRSAAGPGASATLGKNGAITDATPSREGARGDGHTTAQVRDLAERLQDWLRREAMLGVAVLLCVALLGAFAGSLSKAAGTTAPPPPGAYVSPPEKAGDYTLILKVTPDTFGTNTFTVTVKDAAGKPVEGAAVEIGATSLDMDMGTQNTQLQPMGASAPGSYSGQADLTMAGKWGVTVKVVPPNSNSPVQADFQFSATY
jgi:copper transport protein